MKRSPLVRQTTFRTEAKPRKCRHCKREIFGAFIHDECIQPWYEANRGKIAAKAAKALKAKAKAERASDKERKEKLKPFSKLEDECRRIVQAIARHRDRHDGCISCHLPATWGGQWHGSHYRSHGACSVLQFHLWNIHKSCSSCNRDKGGNLHGYRPRLIAKIGADRVAWLDAQEGIVKHTPAYREYLIRFKRVMGKRLRRMVKAKELERLMA